MKSTIAQESALIERILTFRDLPLDFSRFMYPWGEEHTPFAAYPGPRRWQIEELGRLQDHLCNARKP
jgi:hypothetical protein